MLEFSNHSHGSKGGRPRHRPIPVRESSGRAEFDTVILKKLQIFFRVRF